LVRAEARVLAWVQARVAVGLQARVWARRLARAEVPAEKGADLDLDLRRGCA
jgi:hypothetical protein